MTTGLLVRIITFLIGSLLTFIASNGITQGKNKAARPPLTPFEDAQAILAKEQEFHRQQSDLGQKEIDKNGYPVSKHPKKTVNPPSSVKEKGTPSPS